MSNAYQDLINFWRNFQTKNLPFIASQDEQIITKNKTSVFSSYNSYVQSNIFGNNQDKSLHVGLLPTPYVGNLEKATIFILMLNPGLSSTDYYGEYQNKDFRKAHLQNLRQENKTKFPFHFLNPEFSWHGGFNYWHNKLGHFARVLTEKKNISYSKALEFLSKRVACLELIPYHSKSFGQGSLINQLQSAKVMRRYVKDILLKRANQEEITVVVARGAKYWDLYESKTIKVFKSSEARSAHLTVTHRGGKAIAKQLGL